MGQMLKTLASFALGLLLGSLFFIVVLGVPWVERDSRCDEAVLEEGGIVFFPPGHYDCRDLLTRALDPFVN